MGECIILIDMIMNREIKFRGLNKKNNQWLYGYFFKYTDGRTVIYESDSSCWEVLSSSVGQYTGLNDCKGNEIYEGDIVEFMNLDLPNMVIRFDNGSFMLCEDEYSTYEELRMNYKVEVVGNIHDNPELLTNE